MEIQQQACQTIPDSEILYREYVMAFRVWLQLYRDAEWWTDPQKRRVITQARIAYQDAKINYLMQGRQRP